MYITILLRRFFFLFIFYSSQRNSGRLKRGESVMGFSSSILNKSIFGLYAYLFYAKVFLVERMNIFFKLFLLYIFFIIK